MFLLYEYIMAISVVRLGRLRAHQYSLHMDYYTGEGEKGSYFVNIDVEMYYDYGNKILKQICSALMF